MVRGFLPISLSWTNVTITNPLSACTIQKLLNFNGVIPKSHLDSPSLGLSICDFNHQSQDKVVPPDNSMSTSILFLSVVCATMSMGMAASPYLLNFNVVSTVNKSTRATATATGYNFFQSLFSLDACTLSQMHEHPRSNEFAFVLAGEYVCAGRQQARSRKSCMKQ
jgi:quercetin dioxygenase-like cupin family protein